MQDGNAHAIYGENKKKALGWAWERGVKCAFVAIE